MTSTFDLIANQELSTIDIRDIDEIEKSKTIMSKEEPSLNSYISEINGMVKKTLEKSTDTITPWFFKNMPKIYYHTTPKEEKVTHLSTIISSNIFESKQTIQLWNQDKSKTTFIGPAESLESFIYLSQKIKQLNPALGWLYVSHDNRLFISTFFCRSFRKIDPNNKFIANKIISFTKLLKDENPNTEKNQTQFIKNLDHDFIKYTTPERLQFIYKMLNHMLNHESSHTILFPAQNPNYFHLVVGFKGVTVAQVFEDTQNIINRYEHSCIRYFINNFSEGYSEPILIIYFIIKANTGVKQIEILQNKLSKAIRTISWTDSDQYIQFTQAPFYFSTNASNLIRTLAVWTKIILSKENVYYYSDHNILTTFLRYRSITSDIIELFRLKFNPDYNSNRDKTYQKNKTHLQESIEHIIDKVQRKIIRQSINFIDNCLKTNYFFYTKTGLAFRIDPKVLDKEHYQQSPYGIFFITGRNYRFFHVRWKDVARGGLRVVTPQTSIDYHYALSGLFDEVYGLSYAQQLKNKDIPEGGSKGVMIVHPQGNRQRAIKGAVNALLDLIVTEDETHENQQKITYDNKEEILYLGPDENISNSMICWIQEQAYKRGYNYARSFMSSNPDDGINHKIYGVTSRGLHVYVSYVLSYLKIDPTKQTFTVKMTGGPDGDVAGNEIKLLYASYKEQCKIVAIADGFGAAFDPQGLNWQELLRLVKEEKSICKFNPKLLRDSTSFVVDISTRENIQKRNNIHNEAQADLFIPAGGRPYTINQTNVHKFLNTNDLPSSRAIIEGANIFITKDARQFLQTKGVCIIKDSSANKTGVICSSYEIIASLVLNKQEFLEIKETYIDEVITILENKANLEAKLLIKEISKYENKYSLTEISQELSYAINNLTDLLMKALLKNNTDISKNIDFQQIILNHCPKCIRTLYQDRILDKLPIPYQLAIIASYSASYIIYKEGLYWINSIPVEDRFEIVMIYLKNDKLIKKIVTEFQKDNLNHKKNLSIILNNNGARALTLDTYFSN
jgi:glutamate dehydrogenase